MPLQAGIDRVNYLAHGQLIRDPESLIRGSWMPEVRKWLRWARPGKVERALRSSVVHSPNYFLPPQAETGIITVHDLSVFRYPDTHPLERISEFEQLFTKSLARARHIITDSETVRREVIEDFGVAEQMITAVPLGIDASFRPCSPNELRSVNSWGLIPGNYALCVSTLEPRKKITELLSAWRNLSASLRDSYPLVLAGGKGWLNEDLHEQINVGVSQGWLKHLGFVAEPALPTLYSGAALFVYPSVYEGFGLPPLEAMACGVPTIVANSSCFPEVTKGAAMLVQPEDVDAFTRAIELALEDRAWRAQAISAGIQVAHGYTWANCVAQTTAVYGRSFTE